MALPPPLALPALASTACRGQLSCLESGLGPPTRDLALPLEWIFTGQVLCISPLTLKRAVQSFSSPFPVSFLCSVTDDRIVHVARRQQQKKWAQQVLDKVVDSFTIYPTCAGPLRPYTLPPYWCLHEWKAAADFAVKCKQLPTLEGDPTINGHRTPKP